jgi:hypothetical protein
LVWVNIMVHGGEFTHPGLATLADPLFRCAGKRVKNSVNLFNPINLFNYNLGVPCGPGHTLILARA